MQHVVTKYWSWQNEESNIAQHITRCNIHIYIIQAVVNELKQE